MWEKTFKHRLVQEANVKPGMRLLDLGCGTGTLTMMLKGAYPNASITALDGDPQILEIARKKASGMDIQWEQGLAYALPYSDASFDRVVTSLVIHHLARDDKRRSFQEVYRILRSGGELYVLDFGAPHSDIAHLITRYMRHLEEVADNFDDLIPQFILEAGFESVLELDHFFTVLGPLSLWRVVKKTN